MPRAIIRYSFDGDEGKPIRTEIRKRLMADGLFVASGTGSWESAEGTAWRMRLAGFDGLSNMSRNILSTRHSISM